MQAVIILRSVSKGPGMCLVDSRVERRQRSQIQAAHNGYNEATDKVRVERNIKPLVHFGKPLVSRQSSVPCEAPAESTLPDMTRYQAAQSCRDDERLKHNRSSLVAQCLVEYLENRHSCCRQRNLGEVTDNGEEHGHGEEPARYKADTHCAHDGDGHHFLRPVDLFREVGGAIEAGKAPIRVHEPDDESYTALLPASIIDKGCEDELSMLMRRSDCRNRNQNNGKRHQRRPKRDLSDCGQCFAITVEKKAEDVGELICQKDVPRFD